MLERAIRPSFCLYCFCLVFDGSHLHPRLRSDFDVPPADTRRAGYPMRPRGRIECVHALSSFQRTKACGVSEVKGSKPFKFSLFAFPADELSFDNFPAPFRGTLRVYDAHSLRVNPFFAVAQDFLGRLSKDITSSVRFAKPGDLPGSHDVLDREHRVKRV